MIRRASGPVVIVTGAGRGIGRATARAFAAEGARLMLLGRSMGPLDELEHEITAVGGEVLARRCDVGDATEVASAVTWARERWGRIDVLVNNAGITGEERPFLDLPAAEWDDVMRVNLRGAMLMSQAAGRVMAAGGGGVILHNASIAGLGVDGAFAAYCAAKAGLLALNRSMAVELAPFGIRVNAVSPGYTRTDMTMRYFGEGAAEFLSSGFVRAPMRRVVEPEEVASAFVYLASPGASGITGANLVVDGGLTANLFIAETVPERFKPGEQGSNVDPEDTTERPR